MSLKDLFESTKVTKSGSADETAYEVESEAYMEAFTVNKDTFVPPVDFATASNFARYGSAARYYEDSIVRVHAEYPYDGSRAEILEFRNSSSYLDQWVFDNRYPRTTGYVSLGTTSGSGDWLTMVTGSTATTEGATSGDVCGGYGMPDTSTTGNILEYIEIKAGPHTGSSDRTFEEQPTSLKKMFSYSNVYDAGSARESNMEFNLETGVTVEFWLLKNDFYTTKTEREVVFDLWNNENSSSTGYGRLMIELSGTSITDESVIRLTAQSGTSGFVNEGIATISTSDVADGIWKHYAITLKNSSNDDGVNAKLYVNGQVSGSALLGSDALGRVTGSLIANIGALAAPPSGATGYYDTTTIVKGGAKLSASLDEFRYWKLERDPRQIGRNWFTQVRGGTNTDDANVGLGVYYKFNEGITDNASRDNTILDYSGRISNGVWHGGVSSVRNTGSALVLGSHSGQEYHDPIIYSAHAEVQALKDDMIPSGTLHDNRNNSMLHAGFPDWTLEESTDSTMMKFTQIIGSYFDKLHLQIESIQKIKERYGSSYSQNVYNAVYKPVPFAEKLVSQFGIVTPELLQEAEMIENFLNRNEKMEYGENIADIRNQIYSNIYANLLYIFKTKGTEKSFRNMLRCFGIDDELVKINVYADNSEYIFRDNRRSTTNKTNYVSFSETDRFDSTVYQAVSMSVDGIYDNPNARAYITGSSGFGEFNAQTLEAEIYFPLKPGKDDPARWYQDSFHTASLFGAKGTVESQTDTRFPTADNVDVKVFAIKDEYESTRAKFVMESDALGTLTSSYYEDVYDDTRWNFAVRVKPSKSPWVDHISGSEGVLGAQTFDVEFYGVNVFTDVVQHEFLSTTTVSETVGKAFLSSSKRCYVGALRNNFTSSTETLYQTNVDVGNLRYWLSDISDEVVLSHAMDQSSFGVSSPYKGVFLYESSMSGTFVPQIETLALHWNFDNVTGSGVSPSAVGGTYDAQFIVQDVSSGSAENADRYGTSYGSQAKMQHLGIGDFFLENKTNVVNTRYIPTAKLVLPEYLHSSDMVEIRRRDDEFFTRESRPSKVVYSIEKSMYQTISEEMIKMFATIKDFDNLIGEPVNRYRAEYKDLGKLRQLFFEKMSNSPDLDKYVDYYKWIDSAISRFLEQLMPASAMSSEGLRTMVESHVLERSKYQTKYPSMEFQGDPPIGSAEGINKLLYNYEKGSAPLAPISFIHAAGHGTGSAEMMDDNENCLWWSKRAEREHPILASTAMSASDPGLALSGTLATRIAIFSASAQTFKREWSTPYKYSVAQSKLIHGGVNFDDNKNLGYVYPATVPFSPRPVDYGVYGGYPLGYLLAKDMDLDASPAKSLPNCDIRTSSSYGGIVKREGYKVIDGWETFKSNAGNQGRRLIAAATATITITDYTELNAGDKVNLVATDGTNYDFTQGDQSSVNGTFEATTSNDQTATNLMNVINTSSGPSGTRFTATVDGATVTVTQATAGASGNTTITLTDSGTAGMSSVATFTGGEDRGLTPTPNWGSASYTTFRGNLVMPFNVISSSQHDVCEGYTQLIDQNLTVFQGSGVGHSDDAGTYVNRRAGPYYDAPATSATKMGGLGEGVNLVNLHTDTYGEDKEAPMQGPFTEKYVGGRKFRHADINDGTDTLATREEGYLLLVSTAMSYSSGVINADSGAVGLVGPDYPYPHGPYPFRAGEASQWRPIGGRYFRDETAKRPVNIRNIQTQTASVGYQNVGLHRHDTITTSGDDESLWTFESHEQIATGSARTIIGNYRHNYEVVHTVGRSSQKPYLRDNQSVRNIIETGSLAASTHVESILTQKFMASGSDEVTRLPYDIVRTTDDGARVIVSTLKDTALGFTGDDEHIFMDHATQDRSTGSTNLNTIFANKFSAPGGPRNQSKGFLDLAAEEYSVYNAYPWRNLEVLGSSSGEYLSTHAQIHSSSDHPRLGLRSLRAMASGRFGAEAHYSSSATPSGIVAVDAGSEFAGTPIAPDPSIQETSEDYTLIPSWHKVHRNGRIGHYVTTTPDVGATIPITLLDGSTDTGDDQLIVLIDAEGLNRTYKVKSTENTASGHIGVNIDAALMLASFARCIAAKQPKIKVEKIADADGHTKIYLKQLVPGTSGNTTVHCQITGMTPPVGSKFVNGALATHVHTEKTVYDNDYVTRPIPQNDYQYAWISASLAPSSSTSTYHNLGHGYHIDAFNHPTPSGSRPVDPILFISASDAGSGLGSLNTHASADRGFRYFGIASGVGTQHIPNVHRLNLNIRDSQNTWLTDGSGAVALGFFASGGILAADEPRPIGHDTNESRGGFAYSSRIANLHNYVNTAIQYAAGLRVNTGNDGDGIRGDSGDPANDRIYLQGAFVEDNDLRQLWKNEPIRRDLLPNYWSGSDGAYTHAVEDAYALNQSVASIFNSLMWKRNGPYGYPTWKQIRGGEHILAQTMRKNNRYVLVDPQSDRIVNPPPGQSTGRVISSRGMIGTDAVAAFRIMGHVNTAERKHNHYYVPVADSSAKSLIVALQIGSFAATIDSTIAAGTRFVAGESRDTLPTVVYSIIPDDMLYVNMTYQNNLRYFPVSALNTDLGIRDYKSDRTAYDDLYEMYTEMTDLDGNDAYTLADLIYRQTIFPKAENVGRQDTRQRARFGVGYWAADADAELIPPSDDTHLEPYYDPTGRRTFFDHPDPAQVHSVWEFYRGDNASVNRMAPRAPYWWVYSAYADDLTSDPSTSKIDNEKRLRNRATLAVSASIWPMDGAASIESLTGNDGTLGSAQYRASASVDSHGGVWGAFGMYARDAAARTHGAPGVLQNQYTWFHNGLKLGYEPAVIGTLNPDLGDDQADRKPVISSTGLTAEIYADISQKVGTYRVDDNDINISERYLEFPAAGMAFGPSYSRPHMMVGRDSYCSPSAGKAAYTRRFLFASETAELTGAATFGKGDGLDPIFTGLDDAAATVPFTASVAPNSRDVGDRAISQLTRSIGHQVEGLYVSDWEWKAPLQSGKSPFYANYADWFEELRGKSQDRQVIPEYRISDRIRHFVLDKQGRFTSKDNEWLSIQGNPSSSAGSLTGSSDSTGVGSTITASFMTDYAVTAKTGLFDAIKSKHAGIAEPYELTLTCDAILKFLPYQGFYPQLRTVDLCKQFIDSYDEHVTFESDLGINDLPSSFVRADSSGSIVAPGAGISWWGFNPWSPTNYGSADNSSRAEASLTFQVGGIFGTLDNLDRITLNDGAHDFIFEYDVSLSIGTHVQQSAYYWKYRPQSSYLFGLDWVFPAALHGAINDARSVNPWIPGDPLDIEVYFSGLYNENKLVLTQGTAGTAGNTDIDMTNGGGGAGPTTSQIVVVDFAGGVDATTVDLISAHFYSNTDKSGYTFSVDEIVDPTSPRVGGSGKLTNEGFETHGRNAAAAKRPFYGPFMAPGILFNTIKSGIAVDYPILNRQLATTASVDRDGGRNYQILNEYFDNRLPFETLIEPEKYLTNVPLVDMEPHPSASLNVTASWDGQGDPLYKMMMHNFLAEIPNFYLANQQMQSFTSLPESDGGFGQVEAVVHNGDQVIPEYRMMVKVWKSQESMKRPVTPSASNHWQNHRGPLHPIKTKAHDGTSSGSLALLGEYEPCYYTDVIGMEAQGLSHENASGVGQAIQDYQSPHGVKYNNKESRYPRPQSDAPETITMYSRPSAFGPPCAGGYAFEPELEYIFTGSAAAPMSMSMGRQSGGGPPTGADGHVPGVHKIGKIADRVSTTYGMKDGTNGYNAPFTPPYYDGQAWAFVTFKPTRTGKHYLDDIWENTTINFLRYEFDYVSGAYGDWGTVGPQGYAMNVNAMQVDASVNIKGKTQIKEVTYDAVTGLPRTVSDSLQSTARNSAWVIQTKFETPILHFGYGVTDNQSALTLSGSDSASALIPSNGYHHGYPGLCEPIGMWHQYGEIPSASQGIYLEIADIPRAYLRYGTEMTIANPKWLHITGSPDPKAGCTAGITTWYGDGDVNTAASMLHGTVDWDGYHNHVSSSGALYNTRLSQSNLVRGTVTNNLRPLRGEGYRFSGSFSGSEEAYVVGRDTINHPDSVRDGTLERGGRQQYMRWRLMSTGSLAGIVADMTHLQIVSADDGMILDTTWGCPLTRNAAAAPGISGSGPCYERGFYITVDVTGSNIISGSSQEMARSVTVGSSSTVYYVGDDYITYLNRGYPGTSSARQRLMGIGKLTSSLAHDGAIPFRNYYSQWKFDVPNNPRVDKQALASSYLSPLHKNKRGVIPEEPHFSNNISTGSFGDALGCSLYSHKMDPTTPYGHEGLGYSVVEFQNVTLGYATATITISAYAEVNAGDTISIVTTGGDTVTITGHANTTAMPDTTGASTNGTFSCAGTNNAHRAVQIRDAIHLHEGFTATSAYDVVTPANVVITITQSAPGTAGNTAITLTNTAGPAGMTKTDFVGGVGSGTVQGSGSDSGNSHLAVGIVHAGPLVDQAILANGHDPLVPISNSVGIGRAEIIAGYTGSGDDQMWKVIDGCLSGASPQLPNCNFAFSNFTHGETSYERWSIDYYNAEGSGSLGGAAATATITIIDHDEVDAGDTITMVTRAGATVRITGDPSTTAMSDTTGESLLGTFACDGGNNAARGTAIAAAINLHDDFTATTAYVGSGGGDAHQHHEGEQHVEITITQGTGGILPTPAITLTNTAGPAGMTKTDFVGGGGTGVVGWHADGLLTDGLEDVYPLGMTGHLSKTAAGYTIDENRRLSEIKMWYTNPVHIANVRWADMMHRTVLIDSPNLSTKTKYNTLPDLEAAICSPRTVPSGKFLPVGGIQALTKSLGSLVGFESGAKKLGQLAETRTVKEAVVVMPYVMTSGRRLFVELDKTQIDRYFARGSYSNTGYWAAIESMMDLKGAATSPESGLQVNLGTSVLNQIQLMGNYVFPPHLDFTRTETATPYAMYIFEYEHQFSAQDLSDMWQGLFPDSGKVMRQVTKQVTHKLNILELLGASAEDGEKVPDQIRFMVFKVKQRAEINYFAKTKTLLDDDRFKFKFKAGENKKSTDYSYNWPYDFFSLVETAKIDLSISLRNKKLIDSVELQELNPDLASMAAESMSLAGVGAAWEVSAPSISEEVVRAGHRQATAAGVAEAVRAVYR